MHISNLVQPIHVLKERSCIVCRLNTGLQKICSFVIELYLNFKIYKVLLMWKQRTRDAEAELNLPPGFRFHPTDEELVVHYLYQKISCQRLPVPIIAEVDLYKYDPWELPEKALFGQREWYFFTPRDRKYPNGSRPNRAAGKGYWKATGADKAVMPKGSNKPLGIKKALVFYAGKAPRGVKTDWIMHEYRLVDVNQSANKKGSLRLDEWVLCRLYNKKGTWQKIQQQEDASSGEAPNSAEDTGSVGHVAPESYTEHDTVFPEFDELGKLGADPSQACGRVQSVTTNNTIGLQKVEQIYKEDNWFVGLNLEDFQNCQSMHSINTGNQDYYSQYLASQMPRSNQAMPPF